MTTPIGVKLNDRFGVELEGKKLKMQRLQKMAMEQPVRY
jgi:hypothetical protein